MDADMVAMFPNGIRALMIDDDTKFLKSATTLLSVLNFEVVRCGSVGHALKSLTGGRLVGFDVILVHAANVAACGFDFRAIVETDLLIPVIYFLEEDYEATGDEADELLRTLQATGSYIIKKPLDIDEVRTRLWMVIAFRKCDLQANASRGAGAGGEGVGGDDEDRVHFKVVTKGRGRKRKGASSSKHGTTVAEGGHRATKGKEKQNVGSQQQPAQQNNGRAKKAQKSGGGEGYNLPQPNTAMMNGQQQHVQHQPNPSDLFMHSFLRMLAMPPNNPKLFTNATVPSYNPMFFSAGTARPSINAAAFGNTINTTGGAPAKPPCLLYSAASPALHPVARQQQHPSAHNNVIFGNIAPSPAAAPTMATAAAAYELQFSQGISNKQQQEQDDVHPLLMFGPFPCQGPTPPPPPTVVEQDILAPSAAAGDPFADGVAGGGMTGGASATAATEGVAYGNDVSLPFLQASNLSVEQDGAKEFPAGTVGMGIMYSSMAPPMAPQQVSNALDEAAMLESLLNNGFNSYNNTGSPHVVPEDHQVLGVVSNLNEPTAMGGGALVQQAMVAPAVAGDLFAGGMEAGGDKAKMLDLLFNDDFNARSSLGLAAITPDDADQVPGMASSLNELTTLASGAFGSSSTVPLMASQAQDIGTVAMEGDDDIAAGHKEAMLPSDRCEDDDSISFPLDALLGDLHGPMFELDDDDDLDTMQVGGSTGGGATAVNEGTGASLIAEEEGGGENGLSNLAGIDIPHDVWHMNDLPSMQLKKKNNVRE